MSTASFTLLLLFRVWLSFREFVRGDRCKPGDGQNLFGLTYSFLHVRIFVFLAPDDHLGSSLVLCEGFCCRAERFDVLPDRGCFRRFVFWDDDRAVGEGISVRGRRAPFLDASEGAAVIGDFYGFTHEKVFFSSYTLEGAGWGGGMHRPTTSISVRSLVVVPSARSRAVW